MNEQEYKQDQYEQAQATAQRTTRRLGIFAGCAGLFTIAVILWMANHGGPLWVEFVIMSGLATVLCICWLAVICIITSPRVRLIVTALTLSAFLASQAQAAPVEQAPPPTDQRPEVVPACLIVVVYVTVVGIIVVYQLVKFCREHLPPPQIPPPPPPTNSPTPGTNTAITGLISPACWSAQACVSNVLDSSVLVDVAAYAWTDPSNNVYQIYLSNSLPFQSSTDLSHWQNCAYSLWVSPKSTMAVTYDGQGNPMQTNYCQQGGTNRLELGLPVTKERQKFFRMVSQ